MEKAKDSFQENKLLIRKSGIKNSIYWGLFILTLFILLAFGQFAFSMFKFSVSWVNSKVNPPVKFTSSMTIPNGPSAVVLAESIPVCGDFDKSNIYTGSDIVRFVDGRVLVYQVSNPSESTIKICKYFIVKDANDDFAKDGKNYSISKYYPLSNTIVISTIDTGRYGFYNVAEKKTIFAELPKLERGSWTSAITYAENQAYVLFYPTSSVVFTCIHGGDISDCDKVKTEFFNQQPIYIFREDGKQVKLLDKNTSNTYTIALSPILYGQQLTLYDESSKAVYTNSIREIFGDPMPIELEFGPGSHQE
jgi:hypothetical protein